MLLIGTMNWSSTRLKGVFQCPHCDANQKFRLKATRPFLTLYFIPVIPIGGLQEFVECQSCQEAFESIVLANNMLPSDTPSGEDLAHKSSEPTFEHDLLNVIALMMVEDGHVTEGEIDLAQRIFENMTDRALSRDQLGNACSQVQQHRLSVLSFLATSANRRTHEEKLLMLQAMFAVAGADGQVTEGRMQGMLTAQATMEIEPQEFEGAINATDQWLK